MIYLVSTLYVCINKYFNTVIRINFKIIVMIIILLGQKKLLYTSVKKLFQFILLKPIIITSMPIMYAMLDHEYITVLNKINANTHFKCPQIKRIVSCRIIFG